jgi:exosortase
MIIGLKYKLSPFQLALCGVPLLWLWSVLINHLRIEWALNPQYAYGWAVPCLCAYFIWKRIQYGPEMRQPSFVDRLFSSNRFVIGLSLVLGLLYFPTRLIQEANPDWRLVSIGLTVEAIGLTFCLLHVALQNSEFTIRDFIFPVSFFFVAVPWPSFFENPLIQLFTRWDVLATTEIAGLFGIPALPHGNVIEVATGQVGIDEACSGIRSFQATLMVSLFLGEFLQLGRWQRFLLVGLGFSLSLLFNFIRLVVLVLIASNRGIAAVNRWHDSTGVTILLGCFFGLWFLAQWLKKKYPATKTPPDAVGPSPFANSDLTILPFYAFFIATFWLLLAETGVYNWYRYHELRMPPPLTWNINWPTNSTLQDVPITPVTRQYLRYDEGINRKWQADNLNWQAVFLRWDPGSIATRLAYNHTPEICLKCAGYNIAEQSSPMTITVKGLDFSFLFYRIGNAPQPTYVAYSLWLDRAATQNSYTASLGLENRLKPVRAGQRSTGQRSLELVLAGGEITDFNSAKAAVERLLNEIIVREN